MILLKKTFREIAKKLQVSNTTIKKYSLELKFDKLSHPIYYENQKISYISEMLFGKEKKFGYYDDIALDCINEITRIRDINIEYRKNKKK